MQLPVEDARFRHMYMTHRDAVWSYVLRRVDRNEVEDVVAEVFVVAWRRIDGCPSVDEQLPWLYGVSKNVIRNTNRSAARRQRLWNKAASTSSADVSGSDVQVVQSFEDEQLLRAVSRLRPIDQELLRLRTWEELSIKDIALVVDMSPKGVESRLVRIRKNLAQMLAVPTSRMHAVCPDHVFEGGES